MPHDPLWSNPEKKLQRSIFFDIVEPMNLKKKNTNRSHWIVVLMNCYHHHHNKRNICKQILFEMILQWCSIVPLPHPVRNHLFANSTIGNPSVYCCSEVKDHRSTLRTPSSATFQTCPQKLHFRCPGCGWQPKPFWRTYSIHSASVYVYIIFCLSYVSNLNLYVMEIHAIFFNQSEVWL